MNLYFFPDFSPQLLTFMFHCFLDTFYGSVSEATQTHFFSKSRLISISSQTAKEPLHRVPVLENWPFVQWCVRSLGSIPEITFSPLTLSWFQLVAVPHQCYLPSLLSITLADTTAIFLSRPSLTCPLCSCRWDLRFSQLILKCASDVLFARFQTRHHHSSQLWSVKPLIAGGVVNSGP